MGSGSTNRPYYARKSPVSWEENYWPTEEHVSEAFPARAASPGQKNKQPAWAEPRLEVSTTLAASRRADFEKKRWICNTWNTKLFCDVNIFCGVDRRVVKTSRLFLCGLSQYLRNVFLEHSSSYNEDIALILPDVDSAILSDFLRNVSSGQNVLAKIDESLNFLDFGNIPDPIAELTSSPGPERTATSTGSDFNANSYNTSSGLANGSISDELARDGDQRHLKDVGSKQDNIEEAESASNACESQRKNRKKSSLAWKFFRHLKDKQSECLLCKDVLITHGSTTTKMLQHLRRFHVNDYSKVLASKIKKLKKEEDPENFSDFGTIAVKSEPTNTSSHHESSAETSMETEKSANSSSCNSNSLHLDSSSSKDGDSSGPSLQGQDEDDKGRVFNRESIKHLERLASKRNSTRRRSSFAWKYFKRTSECRAECSLCKEAISYSGSTTGMLKHLQFFHRDVCPGNLVPGLGLRKQSSKKPRKMIEGHQVHEELQPGASKSTSVSDEMRPEVFSSSPIWMIFKPDEDNPSDSKCSLCNQVFAGSVKSTVPLIHHIRESHTTTFKNIKTYLEAPNLPETYDPVNPLWLYFTISDARSTECIRCNGSFDIRENGAVLIDHLSVGHPELHDVYLHHCTQWRLQRKEEFCTYKSSLGMDF